MVFSKVLSVILLAVLGTLLLAAGYFLDSFEPKHAAFIAMGLLGSLILFVSYETTLILLFIFCAYENFLKVLTNYNPAVHVGADLLVGTLVLRTIGSAILKRGAIERPLPPFTWVIGLHFLWFFIAMSNPTSISIVASMAASKMFVNFVLLYFYGYYLVRRAEDVPKYFAVWVLTTCVHIGFSLYQVGLGVGSVAMFGPQFVARQKLLLGDHAFRPYGLSGAPGSPAVFIHLTIAYFTYFALAARTVWVRWIAIALMAPAVTTLVACQMRASIFKSLVATSLFGALLILGAKISGKIIIRRIATFAAVAAAIAIFAVPVLIKKTIGQNTEGERMMDRSMSLFDSKTLQESRSHLYDLFLSHLIRAPLGQGMSRTGAAGGTFVKDDPYQALAPAGGYFSDNFFVAVVIELGAPGVILLSIIVFGILLLSARSLFHITDAGTFAVQAALLSALFALVTGFKGAECILYNPEAAFFWFFAGCAMRIRNNSLTGEPHASAARL